MIVGASAWLSRLIHERLASRWRREEHEALEQVRSSLESSRMLLEAAIQSYSGGQSVFQARRVEAIEHLWSSVVEMREAFAGVFTFYSVLLPEEYARAYRDNRGAAALIQDVTDETIAAVLQASKSVERYRPHLGETLWSQFFIYRAFLGRIGHLIARGKEEGRFSDWRDDDGVRQILSQVLPEEVMEKVLAARHDVRALHWVESELQGLMLQEISLIVSGSRSSEESFKNAKRLRESLAQLEHSGV